jgi:hypothetical protein
MHRKYLLPGFVAGIFVIMAGLALAAGSKIIGGPFIVGVTSQTATIAWIVQSDTVTVRMNGDTVVRAPAFRVEKTTLTGLQPNTKYDFDIASGAEDGKGSFKTPPFGPTGSFRFVVYGDNRSRPEVHRKVMAELLKHGIPDFVMQTGDMVANGEDNSQWAEFFDIERDLLTHAAFFPTLGNHEKNTHYFSEFFQQSVPYYSFDWGGAHFTVLNSDIMASGNNEQTKRALWAEEARWLEDDLQQHQGNTFRFVMAHHPPITAVASRQKDNPHMTALIPLFEKYHVTAGFFGHDHNYQHYLKGGIHYVTTGGGGAPLYDVKQPPEEITQKVVSIENFVSVLVNGKTAHFQAIAIDGTVFDQFDIKY